MLNHSPLMEMWTVPYAAPRIDRARSVLSDGADHDYASSPTRQLRNWAGRFTADDRRFATTGNKTLGASS